MTRKLPESNAGSQQVRFSIKDLLWLMTLIGIGVGWYLDHQASAIRREADWNALSWIDTGLQLHPQSMKEFQKELDELQNEPSTPKEEMKQTGNER